jgi:hypothetical protein
VKLTSRHHPQTFANSTIDSLFRDLLVGLKYSPPRRVVQQPLSTRPRQLFA